MVGFFGDANGSVMCGYCLDVVATNRVVETEMNEVAALMTNPLDWWDTQYWLLGNCIPICTAARN